MFEELNQPKPNMVPPASPPPATGRPASVLKTPAVEDIFSQTDLGQARIARPIQPGQAIKAPVAPMAEEREIFGGRTFFQKKIILILAVVVLIAAIIGVVWGVYNLAQPSQKPAGNTPANIPINQNQANQNQTVNTNQETNTQAETIQPKDSDGDGLTDDEEKGLGTDPNKADTDDDGLNDRAEIMLFKTNPLNPDTDGDTFLDGKEVINGYDPNKPGSARLYQTP